MGLTGFNRARREAAKKKAEAEAKAVAPTLESKVQDSQPAEQSSTDNVAVSSDVAKETVADKVQDSQPAEQSSTDKPEEPKAKKQRRSKKK